MELLFRQDFQCTLIILEPALVCRFHGTGGTDKQYFPWNLSFSISNFHCCTSFLLIQSSIYLLSNNGRASGTVCCTFLHLPAWWCDCRLTKVFPSAIHAAPARSGHTLLDPNLTILRYIITGWLLTWSIGMPTLHNRRDRLLLFPVWRYTSL